MYDPSRSANSLGLLINNAASILASHSFLLYIRYVREKNAAQPLVSTMLVIITALGEKNIAINSCIIGLN